MNMTRKRASTTAYQAFTRKNLHLHFRFWNYTFPGGIVGVRRRDLLDIDEMALQLKDANANYGHAVRNCRCRKVGHYGRGKFKITIIMAVEAGDPDLDPQELGSVARPRIWYHVSIDAGTSTEAYLKFLEYDVLDKFDENERQRTIMHDNLSAHKSPEVAELVYSRGHRVICRVPYRPNEGPIEFVFDMLECEIRRRWERIHNETQLIEAVHDILQTRKGISGFNKTFIKCGYEYDSDNI